MTGTMSRASLSSPYISETTTSSLLEVKAALKREREGGGEGGEGGKREGRGRREKRKGEKREKGGEGERKRRKFHRQ